MKKTQKHKLRLVGRGRVELPDRVQLNIHLWKSKQRFIFGQPFSPLTNANFPVSIGGIKKHIKNG